MVIVILQQGGTHDVLATCGPAPDQRLLGISILHLFEADGAVAVNSLAVLVFFRTGAGLVGGGGRIGEDVPEFSAQQCELVDVCIGGPEDRLEGPHNVFALVPGSAVGAVAGGLSLDVDAVDVAGGPSQLEQLLGAVGRAAAGPRQQKESLGGGTFVDGME